MVASLREMRYSQDKNISGVNKIPNPVEIKKNKIKGENYNCRKEKDIKTDFSVQNKKHYPCH
jgi:hypothetical protein